MKTKLDNIVDDIPPKTAEKVKLLKVKVKYYLVSFDLRKISTWLEHEKYENVLISLG